MIKQGPTIVVGFLVVHVDDTAAENLGHGIGVESASLLEDTGSSAIRQVATVLGEEDGDRVILEEINLLVIARLGHGALSAPRVDVVTPEVNGLLGLAAVEVIGDIGADIGVIVGSVANTHGSVLLVLDVLLGITNGSLDKGGRGSVGLVVADLVTGKEADDVGVLGKLVNNRGVSLVESDIPLRVVTVDGQRRLAQIRNDVDAGIIEQFHALGVVGLGVDGVGSDGVGAELLEQRNIALAGHGIGERVDELGLAGGGTAGRALLLVSNTLHEELGAVLVEELLALHIKQLALGTA